MKLNIHKLQSGAKVKQNIPISKRDNTTTSPRIMIPYKESPKTNTTSEFIFNPKTGKSEYNPNAKMGLDIVSPEFALMTGGVGSGLLKGTTLTSKLGSAAIHGAAQGTVWNAANLTGSKQDLEGLTTDVLGGAVGGTVLKGLGIGINKVTPQVVKTVINKGVSTITKPIETINTKINKVLSKEVNPFIKNKVVNTIDNHVQGENAIKMFKQYGGQSIPSNSPLGKRLLQYIPEARERYGLVNNTNITDDEIASSLFKQMNEMQHQTNSANITTSNEPRVLFRGDTQRYSTLMDRPTPEKLAEMNGTMDNSLGNLFLGDYPSLKKGLGVERYLGHSNRHPFSVLNENGMPISHNNSGTGSSVVRREIPTSSSDLSYSFYNNEQGKRGLYSLGKLKPELVESGVNDLNAFFVNTNKIRNATPEIAVPQEDFLVLQKEFKGIPGDDSRQSVAKHYSKVLEEAKINKEGLLKSKAGTPLRDEHEGYDFFSVPNWNKNNVKHILPYDLRIPRNWNNPNIYKAILPTIGVTAALINNKN